MHTVDEPEQGHVLRVLHLVLITEEMDEEEEVIGAKMVVDYEEQHVITTDIHERMADIEVLDDEEDDGHD